MYGLENRFKMQVLLGLKRAHCEMGIQQPRTTSTSFTEANNFFENVKDKASRKSLLIAGFNVNSEIRKGKKKKSRGRAMSLFNPNTSGKELLSGDNQEGSDDGSASGGVWLTGSSRYGGHQN